MRAFRARHAGWRLWVFWRGKQGSPQEPQTLGGWNSILKARGVLSSLSQASLSGPFVSHTELPVSRTVVQVLLQTPG